MKKNKSTPEYHEVCLTRQKGEYITIGIYNGLITSFYEEYTWAKNYIAGYCGLLAQDVINQLIACDWRVIE